MNSIAICGSMANRSPDVIMGETPQPDVGNVGLPVSRQRCSDFTCRWVQFESRFLTIGETTPSRYRLVNTDPSSGKIVNSRRSPSRSAMNVYEQASSSSGGLMQKNPISSCSSYCNTHASWTNLAINDL